MFLVQICMAQFWRHMHHKWLLSPWRGHSSSSGQEHLHLYPALKPDVFEPPVHATSYLFFFPLSTKAMMAIEGEGGEFVWNSRKPYYLKLDKLGFPDRVKVIELWSCFQELKCMRANAEFMRAKWFALLDKCNVSRKWSPNLRSERHALRLYVNNWMSNRKHLKF